MTEIIVQKLKNEFKEYILDISEFRDELAVTVSGKAILKIAEFLKNDEQLKFIYCKDVTAIDWATRKNRFTVVYHIYSFENNFTLRIRANIEGNEIDSVSSVWHSANWYERETFDMYGIVFKNHPDLRRMYMPENFEYHPLRKEFPLLGIPGSIPLPKK